MTLFMLACWLEQKHQVIKLLEIILVQVLSLSKLSDISHKDIQTDSTYVYEVRNE
jgi:hypothetical protein